MIPDGVMRWLGPAAILVVGGTVIFGNPLTHELLCEPTTNCLATWVSALSGWAAAFGALTAALLTIGPLREQVREAKRQSDFLVGDAEAEFVLLRNRIRKTVKLQITNWNRRNVVVDRIAILSPDACSILSVMPSDPSTIEIVKGGRSHRFVVTGWHDRAKAPPRRDLLLTLSNKEIAASGVALTAGVSYRVVGQEHERKQCFVAALDIDGD